MIDKPLIIPIPKLVMPNKSDTPVPNKIFYDPNYYPFKTLTQLMSIIWIIHKTVGLRNAFRSYLKYRKTGNFGIKLR